MTVDVGGHLVPGSNPAAVDRLDDALISIPGASGEDAPEPLRSNGRIVGKTGAGDVTRTRDLLITNQLLYQLSYAGLGGGNESVF